MDIVLPPGSLLRIADGVELGVPQAEPIRQDVGGSSPEVDVDEPGPLEIATRAEPVRQDVGRSNTTGLDVS
jgi:hypothetical protein